MKVLFVCKHNRFRSKVAEVIFNSLSGVDEADSGGLMLDEERPYVEEKVLEIMKGKGFEIKNQTPKSVTRQLVGKFDLLIVVADDISKEFFEGMKPKVKKWPVIDSGVESSEDIEKIINDIELRVEKLINNLKK